MDFWDMISNQTPVVDVVNFIATVVLSIVSIIITVVETCRAEKDRKRTKKKKRAEENMLNLITNIIDNISDNTKVNEIVDEINIRFENIERYNNWDDINLVSLEIVQFYNDLFSEYDAKNESIRVFVERMLVNSDLLNVTRSKLLFEFIDLYKKAHIVYLDAHRYMKENLDEGSELKLSSVKEMGVKFAVVSSMYNGIFEPLSFLKNTIEIVSVSDLSKTISKKEESNEQH